VEREGRQEAVFMAEQKGKLELVRGDWWVLSVRRSWCVVVEEIRR
jgi:hypothetical protein